MVAKSSKLTKWQVIYGLFLYLNTMRAQLSKSSVWFKTNKIKISVEQVLAPKRKSDNYDLVTEYWTLQFSNM